MDVPSKVGRYPVARELGRGGMGRVFEGWDPELRRRIAIKVLPENLVSSPNRLQRFKREARALAALNHPGIVTIYSVEEENGSPFITMELIEGQSLDRLIPKQGFPLAQFVEIVLQLVEAVHAAHERNVIHRDLKPSNIMLTNDNRVKVFDFGLAKLAEFQHSSGGETVTDAVSVDHVIMGTLGYMSPEQISGGPIDHLTDIFSLGIILYQMATGKRPFSGSTTAELLSSILSSTATEVIQIRSDLPSSLNHLINRCLEKDPRQRMPSLAHLRGVIQSVIQGHISEAPSTIVGLASQQANVDRSIAVLPFNSLSADPEDEFFVDGISEEIINALGRLRDLKVAGRTSSFSFKGKNEDLRTIGEKLGVSTVLEGSVRRFGKRLRITAQLVDASSGYHLWSERYDREMIDVFEIQDDIARAIASRLMATLAGDADALLVQAGTNDVEALQLYAKGRGLLEQRTKDSMQRALSCFEQAVERDSNYALAWAELGSALVLLQDYGYTGKKDLRPQAQKAIRRSLEIDPRLAEGYCPLALLHYMDRNGPAALKEFHRAIEIRPNYAETYNLLSWLQLLLGDRESGLAAARKAVELNPLSPEAVSHVSLALLARGNIQEALMEARRVRELEPEFSNGPFYEAIALYHLGRLDEAKEILQNLHVTWASSGAISLMALIHAAAGETGEARKLLEQLKELDELADCGLIHAALHEKEEAFDAMNSVDWWNYWPNFFFRYFFPQVLGSLREDPRYGVILQKIDRDWGLHR